MVTVDLFLRAYSVVENEINNFKNKWTGYIPILPHVMFIYHIVQYMKYIGPKSISIKYFLVRN